MSDETLQTSTELITITTRMQCGPAMSALNPRQRAFVIAYNNAGGNNATEAGRTAGYKNGTGLRQSVHALLHDPKIQAAVREDISARFTEDLPDTKAALDKIARAETHPKHFDAIKLKLHQGGLIERTAVDHNVTVTLSFEQKLEQVKVLAELCGDDPAVALKGIIDATPTVISDIPATEDEGPPLW